MLDLGNEFMSGVKNESGKFIKKGIKTKGKEKLRKKEEEKT